MAHPFAFNNFRLGQLFHAQVGASLPDTSSGVHLGLAYNNWLAVVNPSQSAAQTVSVPAGYTDLSGTSATVYTLPAHSGLVLLGIPG